MTLACDSVAFFVIGLQTIANLLLCVLILVVAEKKDGNSPSKGKDKRL